MKTTVILIIAGVATLVVACLVDHILPKPKRRADRHVDISNPYKYTTNRKGELVPEHWWDRLRIWWDDHIEG